jgi:hypothetical protein
MTIDDDVPIEGRSEASVPGRAKGFAGNETPAWSAVPLQARRLLTDSALVV